jgi:hypothetical protein
MIRIQLKGSTDLAAGTYTQQPPKWNELRTKANQMTKTPKNPQTKKKFAEFDSQTFLGSLYIAAIIAKVVKP